MLSLATGAGDKVRDHVLGDTVTTLVVQPLDAKLPSLDDETVYLLDWHLWWDVEIEALGLVDELLTNRGLNDDVLL